MQQIVAHVISHTHWDREWYLTKEEFLPKLVRLIDGLLQSAERDPGFVHFMLDGQTIAIEDYLKIRPENRVRLESAVRANKIGIGPWYILPDELLVSGESHIRNYLIGRGICQSFGGGCNTGYLPDSFGHPEQMPQILQGLGMDTAVFWRGTGQHMEKTEFYWESPCEGRRVLTIHLPRGYGNAGRLSPDMAQTKPRLDAMLQILRDKSHGNVVLLMNGSDHILNQNDIAPVLDAYKQATGLAVTLKLSHMDTFLSDLREVIDPTALAVYKEEFRYGHRDMVLGGTTSTRMILKQRNDKVQRMMERYLEPLSVLRYIAEGQTDFPGYQHYLWRRILENHPHDSICGCSIDPVHQEMLSRFDQVDQLQAALLGDMMDALHQKQEALKADGVLLCFEPTADGLPCFVEAEVDFDLHLIKQVNFNQSTIDDYEASVQLPPLPAGLCARTEDGRNVPVCIMSGSPADHMRLQDETLPEVYRCNRLRIGMVLPPMPHGMHRIILQKTGAQGLAKTGPGHGIENEFYCLHFVEEDGSFKVEDKRSGRILTGFNRFVDVSDAGDEYNYAWAADEEKGAAYGLSPSGASVERLEGAGVFQRLIVRGTLRLPEELRTDRRTRSNELTDCPVEIQVTLAPGVDAILFNVSVENRAKDHRLQVEFPCGGRAAFSSASSAFAVTRRPVDIEIPEVWKEYPATAHPHQGFVDLGDGGQGISLAAGGISEFEAVNEENGYAKLRLTLMRCVGWLSRGDLTTRDGNGGWTLATPDAQCQGINRFRYAVMPHEGTWQTAGSFAMAERMNHPAYLRPAYSYPDSPNHKESGIFLQNECFRNLPADIRLSAYKLSEDGGSIVLRLFSIGSEDRSFTVMLPGSCTKAYKGMLNEQRTEEIAVTDGHIACCLSPYEIATYLFER